MTKERKYKLDRKDSIIHEGVKLYRVVYSGGHKGGYIQYTCNLSQKGRCRVLQKAKVFGLHACVLDDAVVKNEVIINNSVISGRARVSGKSYISESTIGDDAIVGDDAQVHSSIVGRNADINDNACLKRVNCCSNACVSGDAAVISDYSEGEMVFLCNGLHIRGGMWTANPLYIEGHPYCVYLPAPGLLRIGCQEHSITTWMKHYRSIALKYKMREEYIRIYRTYITAAQKYNAMMRRMAGKKNWDG